MAKWPKKVAKWPNFFSKVARLKPLFYKGFEGFLAKWPFFFKPDGNLDSKLPKW